ncbi:MAG: DNA repair protein RecO [Desulfovibrionaceae bacterium]|nr:DNA repair protein RecO [Desulfovibrionaceae bacterium]
MEFSDQAIILRLGVFREADIWVRLFSPRGVFSAFAFGGGRSRRRFSGCLDLFNEVLFQIRRSRHGDYLALREGALLRGPERLRGDWRRLGMARNCAYFMEALPLGAEDAAGAHALFVDLLNSLETREDLPQRLPLFFRARMIFGQGYAFDPDHCAVCGRTWGEGSAVFPPGASGPLCLYCARPGISGGILLRPEALSMLRRICKAPVDSWDVRDIPEWAQQSCARALEAFWQAHAGLHWERGRFRNG